MYPDSTNNLASPDFPSSPFPQFNQTANPFSNLKSTLDLSVGTGTIDMSGFLIVIKVILALIVLICFAVSVYIYILQQEERQDRDKWLKKYVKNPDLDYHRVPKTRWGHVQAMFQSQSEGDWRMAVIEADAMLDDLLMRLGYDGNTLGERLKATTARDFPKRDLAWRAHLIRNKIAHEGTQFNLSRLQAMRVMNWYEEVFRHSRYIN